MSRYYLVVFLIILIAISCTNKFNNVNEPRNRRTERHRPPPVIVDGGITGPMSVYEEEISVYKIDGEVPEGAQILWTIDPPEAGVLGTPVFSEVGFQASDRRGDDDLEAV